MAVIWVPASTKRKIVGYRTLPFAGSHNPQIPIYKNVRERGHYYDTRTGRWTTKTKKTTTGGYGGPAYPGPYVPGKYTGGLSDAEIDARANALADSQIAYTQAQIERQRAAAMAQAQRDAATYQALGGAQMGMISQIPANIQGIRDTAGAAIASFGSQIAGAQQAQTQAEQAANAAFTASQTGGTAAGPTQVDPTATAKAVEAMGGTIPATSQAEIGAASAMAASGMPAVVARATQDQVAMRMSQAAVEDADFRQQLLDAAHERGGIYMDALNNLYDLEEKKYGRFDAEEKRKQDAWELQYKAYTDYQDHLISLAEYQLKLRSIKDAEKASGLKNVKTQAEINRIRVLNAQGWARIDLAKKGFNLRNKSQENALKQAIAAGKDPNAAKSRAYGYIVDSHGNPILDNKGHRIPYYKPPSGGDGKGPFTPGQQATAAQWASDRAYTIARANVKPHVDVNAPTNAAGQGVTRPTKTRATTINEIIDAITPKLSMMGYSPQRIRAIAVKVVNKVYKGHGPHALPNPG